MSRRTDNDWLKVREIFDAAVRTTGDARVQFVRDACGDNAELRDEIESLLSSFDEADDFLETPAAIQVAENVDKSESQLNPGDTLGDYEIREMLGSGGMGEVYLARDPRLDRYVAIKLLRKSFLPDEQANRRLLREARAAALLEHPNICQIYQIGETGDHGYIVMQYIVGSTLAEMMAAGPLGVARSLDLASQIAEGLAEAHSRGIVHRDIKPANVIVNDKGQAKILDFGLAKFIEAETRAETSPRIQTSGSVMGTVPFMSPEQLRGKTVDERSDIFSLGSLLFEMIAAQPAFTRDNNAETISAILNDEPDWSLIPHPLRPILQKCLAKSKEDRYDSTENLLEDLLTARKLGIKAEPRPAETTVTGRAPTTGGESKKKRQSYFWQSGDEPESKSDIRTADPGSEGSWFNPRLLMAGGIGALVLAGVTWFAWQKIGSRAPADMEPLRAVRLVQWRSGGSSNDTDYRVSHDGKFVAYSSSKPEGGEVIYVKQTSGGDEIAVTKDSWRNVSPIWSPDDQQIAYVSIRGDKPGIYKSPALGGGATPLMVTERTNISLRHWSSDGGSIFYEQSGNLYRLDLDGRDSIQVTNLPDMSSNARYISVSPDEKSIAFCDEREEQTDVWMMPLAGGTPVRLTGDADEESRPIWHPDGTRVIYNVSRNDLFQINAVNLDGRPPIQVTRGDGSYELIDLSPDGSKIYYTSWEKRSDISAINIDTGIESEIATAIENEIFSSVSPDGTSVVFQLNASANPTKRMRDSTLMLKTPTQSTPIVRGGMNARWLPDRRQIAFLRWDTVQEGSQLWTVDSVTGEERQLTTRTVQSPSYGLMPISRSGIGDFDFSPDSKRFVFVDAARPRNVWLGSLDTLELRNVTDTQTPEFRYLSPAFSPDGRRIAWTSYRRSPSGEISDPAIAIYDGERIRLIPGRENGRLLGWADEHLVLVTVDGLMKAGPLNANVVVHSLAGEENKTIPFRDVYVDTFTLGPNGDVVTFVARRNDRDDLWTLSLRTGDTKKVTNNGNTRLFYANPAWSPDGKTIYFDKQEQVNTISMFENFK